MIVAELSANHAGSLTKAVKLVEAAAVAGADAIKLQTYSPERIAADVMIESGPWAGRSYHDLYSEGQTPREWHKPLFDLARGYGMVGFSAPFSVQDVEFLESIDCPIYKIASPEIVHLPLIEAAAATGKPLIISTGMAYRSEVREALAVARSAGATDITLLHCVSAYPAKEEDFYLGNMVREVISTGCKMGLSDHSRAPFAAVAATVLGATVIEKHFCLSHSIKTPDEPFSSDPFEFRLFVGHCRKVVQTLRETHVGPLKSEKTSLQYRRSLWAVKGIAEGEKFTGENVGILRPNYGLPVTEYRKVLQTCARCDIPANTPLAVDMLQ